MLKFITIIIGILPSILWLLFYLRRDKRPEPNRLILFIFFLGILIAPIAIAIEYYSGAFIANLLSRSIFQSVAVIFISIALTEELLKYLTVRLTILKNPEFDEPIDAMIYLIVAALGFAAAENIITLFALNSIGEVAIIGILRFWGATFLHTLASGTLGYHLALSMRKNVFKSKYLIVRGLVIAVAIHGLYNYILLNAGGYYLFIIPPLIIVSAILVFRQIKILKNKLSICDI